MFAAEFTPVFPYKAIWNEEEMTVEEEEYDPEQPNGRPKFSRDTTKRKEKRVLPRSGDATTATLWAIEAQNKISEVVSPIALSHFNKKNARSLNKAEVDQLEYLKMCFPVTIVIMDLLKALFLYPIDP